MAANKINLPIELKKKEIKKLLMGIEVNPITRDQNPDAVQKEWFAVRTKLLRLLNTGQYGQLSSYFHVRAKEIRSPTSGPIMLKLAEKLPEFEAMHHNLVGLENRHHLLSCQKEKQAPHKPKILPRRVK